MQILLGQGPWGHPARSVAASEVVDATSTSLSWAQVFGIGVRFHRRTTRLTVRPGPTLCLTLRPQTWQGWAVIGALTAVVIILAVALH